MRSARNTIRPKQPPLFDLDGLAQNPALAIINQDFIAPRHHRIPAIPNRIGAGGAAFGQGNAVRMRLHGRFHINPHDKQANDHYNAHNHCAG